MNSCNNQQPENKTNKPVVILNSDELKIIAEIFLKQGTYDLMKPIFEKVVKGSQAEDGCIYYDIHQDVSDTTNTKYVMVEIWKDQNAIDIHNETPHFNEFKEASKNYIDKMNVTILKVAQ